MADLDLASLIGHLEQVGHEAFGISYDNASSGLTADDVQAAIDELAGMVGGTPVTQEDVEDWVANLLVAGHGVDLAYNDAGGSLTIDVDETELTASLIGGFNEAAQDAIGAILTDTSSIDFTYNDGANTISAVVLPAGVDHDLLLNFVANEHIDHSAVSMIAGHGLDGGGDITASRTFDVDETELDPSLMVNGSFPAGEVIFGGSGGGLDSDPALIWNNTAKRLGIGISPTRHLDVFKQSQNQTAHFLTRFEQLGETTVNQSGEYYANVSDSRVAVNAGITDSGQAGGTVYNVMRNFSSLMPDDSGTLTNLYGMAYQYGHNNTNVGETPLTTNVYGLFFGPYARTGTITNLYDIFLKNITGSNSNVTNRWSIYQQDVNARNAFFGKVGLGNDTPGVMLDLGLAGTTKGVMRLAGNTSGNVTIQPAAAAGTWTLTIPTTDGNADEFLRTDGSGVTSWVAITSSLVSGFDEAAQDAVGTILVDSATIDFTYSDGTPSITAIVIDDSITNTKLANMATQTIKGRTAVGTGDPQDLTVAQVVAMINSTLDHGTLAGLADDDHVQYALLAGRASGQLLYGGTANGENLKLRSTSGGTKGRIYLGSADQSAYLDTLEYLGIGTSTPTARLHASNAGVVNAIGVRVTAHATQAADLVRYESSAAAQYSGVNAIGNYMAPAGGTLIDVNYQFLGDSNTGLLYAGTDSFDAVAKAIRMQNWDATNGLIQINPSFQGFDTYIHTANDNTGTFMVSGGADNVWMGLGEMPTTVGKTAKLNVLVGDIWTGYGNLALWHVPSQTTTALQNELYSVFNYSQASSVKTLTNDHWLQSISYAATGSGILVAQKAGHKIGFNLISGGGTLSTAALRYVQYSMDTGAGEIDYFDIGKFGNLRNRYRGIAPVAFGAPPARDLFAVGFTNAMRSTSYHCDVQGGDSEWSCVMSDKTVKTGSTHTHVTHDASTKTTTGFQGHLHYVAFNAANVVIAQSNNITVLNAAIVAYLNATYAPALAGPIVYADTDYITVYFDADEYYT